MDRFHEIADAAVITVERSVFRQGKVFERGGALYAARGAGFVRLYKDGGTGLPNLRWDDIDVPGAATFNADPHGKLSLPKALKRIEAR